MSLYIDFNTAFTVVKTTECLDCTILDVGSCVNECSDEGVCLYECIESCDPINILANIEYNDGWIKGYYAEDYIFVYFHNTYYTLNVERSLLVANMMCNL